jgi:hypothetical protein
MSALIAWPHSDAMWIACQIYNIKGKNEPTRLQIDTVNQAIRSLDKRKLIERKPGVNWRGNQVWKAVGPIQTYKGFKRAAKKRRLSVV